MWLDSFALLPLVVLGTIQLLQNRKVVLYTVSLFFSIFINYYIGFFICIFIFLFFFCYQICRCKSLSRFFADFGRIALFSVLAIGMTAILSLPALAALQTTHSSVNTFPEGFTVNIISGEAVAAAREAWALFRQAKELGETPANLFAIWLDAIRVSIPPILDGMKQVASNMSGGIRPTFKEGLPNLYCGVATVFLALVYLLQKDIRLRDKLCSIALLAFFNLSFILRQLDYIWHGFHFPNMIPYRFSFLYSFVLLIMAYQAWVRRKQFKLWQLLAAGAGAFVIMTWHKDWQEPVFIIYNFGFLLLYVGILFLAKIHTAWKKQLPKEQLHRQWVCRMERRRQAAFLLPMILCLELTLNVINFASNFSYTNAADYPDGTHHAAAVIQHMQQKEADTLFYRAEVTHTETLNDGALNGYRGISTFTSSANVKVTEFMQGLGFAARNNYNRYLYEEASPVANLFLNLKYMIERSGSVEENRYFEDIYQSGNVHLLENNAYLPLGFLADGALADFEFQYANQFHLQNDLFRAATGIQEDVWDILMNGPLKITGKDVNLVTSTVSGYCRYTDSTADGRISYRYEVQQDGFLCIWADFSNRNRFHIYKNNQYLYSETLSSLPQMFSISDVKEGDVIELRVVCNAGQSGYTNIRAAIMNHDVFQAGYDVLNASTMDLTHFSNTRIEGGIECNRDGLLYTSVPQDGNWQVSVDGNPAEVRLIGDAMIAVNLTEGYHTIVMTYKNSAFDLGWKVSLGCLAVFATLYFMLYSQRKFLRSKQ
jgi:uncharacterized membrane protein YfhO